MSNNLKNTDFEKIQVEIAQKMKSMEYVGKSRHDYKNFYNHKTGQYEDQTKDKIFSHGSSMTEMKRVATNFMKYQYENRGVKSINEISPKDVSYWVSKQQKTGGWKGEGLAASSVKTYANHLCKFFQVKGGFNSLDVKFESVKYTDVTRSRLDRQHDKEINMNRPEVKKVVDFNKGLGLRRNELENFRGDQIQYRNYYNKASETTERRLVIVFEGDDKTMTKGGRERVVPVLKSHENMVLNIKNNLSNETDKVFGKTNPKLDIHALRREYTQGYYKELKNRLGEVIDKKVRVPASPHVSLKDFKNNPGDYKTLPRGYETRRTMTIVDENGEEKSVRLPKEKQDTYDRVLLKEVSSALGHNRPNVVPNHYL